jgi:hypothetical protein
MSILCRIPPALMSIGILIFFEVNGIYGSYDRTLIWIIGPSYYLTVLHSLVARQQLAAVIFPAPISGYPPLPEENRYLHTRSSTGTNAARGANISNPVLVQHGQWEMPDWERSRDLQRRMSFFDDSLEERGEVERMDTGKGVEAWRMRSNSEKSWKSNGVSRSRFDQPAKMLTRFCSSITIRLCQTARTHSLPNHHRPLEFNIESDEQISAGKSRTNIESLNKWVKK